MEAAQVSRNLDVGTRSLGRSLGLGDFSDSLAPANGDVKDAIHEAAAAAGDPRTTAEGSLERGFESGFNYTSKLITKTVAGSQIERMAARFDEDVGGVPKKARGLVPCLARHADLKCSELLQLVAVSGHHEQLTPVDEAPQHEEQRSVVTRGNGCQVQTEGWHSFVNSQPTCEIRKSDLIDFSSLSGGEVRGLRPRGDGDHITHIKSALWFDWRMETGKRHVYMYFKAVTCDECCIAALNSEGKEP
ncbi:hypothetical protein AXG93_4360s1340 [Marchantia polymorpha subsp. ruderalis]|uniref:Uncharacterized protein n=1 Tax=Marchantia polymorpha subsp. ruderalis TaxID=1480154 RepID=A0A176W1I0_MARPO|nr:hypothetical protein AXG93_4360s1340 [Marchantia polymorpha subsp. ruderalis]